MTPFPLHQETLVLFATYMAETNSAKNILCKLSAIKYFAELNGYDDDFARFTRLHRLMRGIKRVQANKFSKPPRFPITPPLLLTFQHNLWTLPMVYEDKLMLWAAMLTAFFGFLRVSEYTLEYVKSYDPATTLCHSDLVIRPEFIDMTIKASKTDPFKVGITIRFMRNQTQLCPVAAILEYLRHCKQRYGPLFAFQDGRLLTRRALAATLSKITPGHIKNLSTHSFRIGAATTAAAAGHPRWLIQKMGRWSSDCYRTYLRIPDSTRLAMSTSLATTDKVGATYDPDNYSPTQQ